MKENPGFCSQFIICYHDIICPRLERIENTTEEKIECLQKIIDRQSSQIDLLIKLFKDK